MNKKALDSVKTANKELVDKSTDLLIKSVGRTSLVGGFLLKMGLKLAKHKAVLYANQRLVEFAIKRNIKNDQVKKAKTQRDIIDAFKNSQW